MIIMLKVMEVLESSLEYPRTGRLGSSHFFYFLDIRILFCTEEMVFPVKQMDISQKRRNDKVTKHTERHQRMLIRHIQIRHTSLHNTIFTNILVTIRLERSAPSSVRVSLVPSGTKPFLSTQFPIFTKKSALLE